MNTHHQRTRNYHFRHGYANPHPSYYNQQHMVMGPRHQPPSMIDHHQHMETLRNPLEVNYGQLSEIRVTPSSTPIPNQQINRNRQQWVQGQSRHQPPPISPYMIDDHYIMNDCIMGNTSSTSRNRNQSGSQQQEGLSNLDDGVAVLDQTNTLPLSNGLLKRQQQIIHWNLIPLIRTCCKDEEEDEDCSICLCELEENTKLVELTCKHKYHVNCIGQWLERQNFCPLCKRPALRL